MALVLFDTNILIDWSKGYHQALIELAHWDDPAISIMGHPHIERMQRDLACKRRCRLIIP